MTILLGIETATSACSVALRVSTIADTQHYARFQIAPREHTDLVLPMIDEVLREATISRTDIDAIAFGCGPGSFIGTRLAVSVAQGLGFALNRPLIPISTLAVLAQTAYEQYACTRVLAGWDARMSEIYWGVYEACNGLMCAVQADQLSAVEDIVARFLEYTCVGNVWDTGITECYPRAESLLTLALAKFNAGDLVPALAAEPVYLRRAI